MTLPKIEMPSITAEPFIRRILDGPVLVAETQVAQVVANLQELASNDHFAELTAHVSSMESDEDFWAGEGYRAQRRPYNVQDGVLIIPVMGTLIHRFSFQMGSTATGYEYIQRAFNRGMDDPEVESIVLHIDSPGGQAAGNFELVEHMVSRRGEKPIKAMVEDKALSGGYSIATAADEIVSTRSGSTGSVGVVVMHINFGKALSNFGVEVNFIKAGERKTDGNPFEPLSDTARARIQQGVDKFYGMFVSTVANNRGMSDDAVRETEADVYDAEESIEVGFADRIGDFRTELVSLGTANTRGIAMSKENETPTIDAAKVESDARIAERKRFSTVMSSEHYAGREELAGHLLENSEMSAEQIAATLEKSPKVEEAPAPAPEADQRNHFAEAMNKAGTPGVGAEDDDADAGANAPHDASASILGDYRKAGGRVRTRTH